MDPPYRQIRARHDDDTITVYQAYSAAIARPAVEAQRFVAPFKLGRMTWIKPSFLWMMYRSGWAEKAGQERVLALDIKREGFEWALKHAGLSSASEAGVAPDEWDAYKKQFPVRVQWDPERDVQLNRLAYRSLQIGLSGDAVLKYVGEWIVKVVDVTDLARSVRELVRAGDLDSAAVLLPVETPYPAAAEWAERLGL